MNSKSLNLSEFLDSSPLVTLKNFTTVQQALDLYCLASVLLMCREQLTG